MVLKLQVIQNVEKFLTPCGCVSFSRALLCGIRYNISFCEKYSQTFKVNFL
jgi:hypothetical protein